MSSPRDPQQPLNLDKHTFGKAPACMYLTVLLNERNNPALARKITRFISETRALLMDVVASHLHTDEMSTSSFVKLLTMIDDRVRSYKLEDPFIGHIVMNILIGEIRIHKRRSVKTSKLQNTLNRQAKHGETVPILKVSPRRDEETEEERLTMLQEKSRKYLQRKGKRNTLY